MLNFTAIDFETANGFRGSACSVGLVRIRDCRPVDELYLLLRPPVGFDRFDPRNVSIHGITADQVAQAPRFGEAITEITEFIGDDVVVAHNAGFDIGVIESGMEVSDLPIPTISYACTLTMARKVYRLPSHALPKAAAEAGFIVDAHHNALVDAHACAAIVIDIARRQDVATLAELLGMIGMQTRILKPKPAGAPESKATRAGRAMAEFFDASRQPPAQPLPDLLRWQDEGTNPEPAPEANPAHPLYGQHVVFTGRLGITRQQAKEYAAQNGAQPASRVNGSTTMVVIGDGVRHEDLDAGDHPSLHHRKVRDAARRRESGQDIAMVTEPEFLQMLEANWPIFSAV